MSLIRPILMYGCEISNMFKINKSVQQTENKFLDNIIGWEQEKLQLMFCKSILGLNSRTTNIAVLGELGIYPIFIKAATQMMKFYIRCKEKSDSLIYEAFEDASSREDSEWLKCVKFLFKYVNWDENQDMISPQSFECILQEKYRDHWKQKLNNDERRHNGGNKMRTYRKFKLIYEMERYITVITDFKNRQALTRLRVSNHNLGIEKGRHSGIPVEQRLCNRCDILDDELHFLTTCEVNHEIRSLFFEKVHLQVPQTKTLGNEDLMIYLLTNENEELIKELGKYVYASFKMRDS